MNQTLTGWQRILKHYGRGTLDGVEWVWNYRTDKPEKRVQFKSKNHDNRRNKNTS